MSDEDSRERSPELGRRRSGSGTEADAAGAEDTARRKPGASPCTRGDKGTPTGRCGCWPGKLWSWGTSHETVRRTLKKTAFPAKGKSSTGYPEAEFVAEFEIYQKPYDPQRPVVCMDEQPVQQGDSRADYRGSDASTTSGRAPPSCSARPCPPGAGRRPASAGRRRTGPKRSPACGRYADCEHPRVRQPQHPHAGSVLRSVLRGRGSWSSEPAIRRSTGAG